MRECFDTKATGPAVLGYAFEELLKKSENPMKRIINVGSGAGSLGRMFDPNRRRMIHYGNTVHYQASKAALNMVSAQQADDFAPHGVKILCWTPGFTVSELGPFNKAEHGAKPTDEAVGPLVDIIEGKGDDEATTFLSEDGKSYPW